MNIIEATKTGKKIRRSGWDRFLDPTCIEVYHADILADDWEVEPDLPRYTVGECKAALRTGLTSGATFTPSLIKSLLYYLEFTNNYSDSLIVSEEQPKRSSEQVIEGSEKY